MCGVAKISFQDQGSIRCPSFPSHQMVEHCNHNQYLISSWVLILIMHHVRVEKNHPVPVEENQFLRYNINDMWFSVKFGQNVHSVTDNDVWTLKPLCSQNASCEQMPRIYQHRSSASQSFVGPSGLLGPSVVNNRVAIDLK